MHPPLRLRKETEDRDRSIAHARVEREIVQKGPNLGEETMWMRLVRGSNLEARAGQRMVVVRLDVDRSEAHDFGCRQGGLELGEKLWERVQERGREHVAGDPPQWVEVQIHVPILCGGDRKRLPRPRVAARQDSDRPADRPR